MFYNSKINILFYFFIINWLKIIVLEFVNLSHLIFLFEYELIFYIYIYINVFNYFKYSQYALKEIIIL